MVRSLAAQFPKPLKPILHQTTVWLCLSIAIALLYRLPALHVAFSGTYVVQDDARQHVFWMQRFVDSGLFPNDFLADYFQSVAPWGYTTLYRIGAALGLDPWTFNKILPVLIAVGATVFAFGVVLELVRMPVAGFVTAMFLNQTLPLRDDVVSATPAAFVYPFFLAFLFFVLQRSWLPTALTVILMGLFYPQGVLVMSGTLLLMALGWVRWKGGSFHFWGKRADFWVIGGGLLAGFLVLLPYVLEESAYGLVLSLEQARTLFALSPRGWSKFFDPDFVDFWLFGKRTGVFPMEWATVDLKVQPQIWLTLAIPFLLLWPGRSQLARTAAPRMTVLLQMAIASLGCYFLAHLLLFKLHLPNRYTEHSLRILVAIGTGVATALLIDRWRTTRWNLRSRLVLWSLLAIWAIAPLFISYLAGESQGNYYVGQFPQLYQYLQKQPKDTLIASLDDEINNIPSFTNRSIFVGGEGFALPYHQGFYDQVKRRSVDLIDAQYSSDTENLRSFLESYPIDLWLIKPEMFDRDWIEHNQWFLQYSEATNAPQLALSAERSPILSTLAKSCAVAELDTFMVVSADCLRHQN